MSNIWFTSDTHLNHPMIIKHCNRPFKDCNEMDETIINNWNELIRSSDIVYHLGDFAYGTNDIVRKIRYKLHGKIHLILGNHDYQNKVYRLKECFSDMKDLFTLKINKQKIILCHYCMNTYDSSHYDAFHLFGHSHGRYHPNGKRYDIGVDNNNFKPIHLDTILEIMKNLPHNENYIHGDELDQW